MTPDAAGIIAQVDAGVLVALVVEARSLRNNVSNNDDETDGKREDVVNEHAWLYLLGIFAVFISMIITINSVAYNKPLSGSAQHIAVDAIGLGFLPFTLSAIDFLMPRVSPFRKLVLLVLLVMLSIWVITWTRSHFYW